jgi:hypothetical protein
VGSVGELAIRFAEMGFVFVVPIFVVSAISQWWDIRRFRGSLAKMDDTSRKRRDALGN